MSDTAVTESQEANSEPVALTVQDAARKLADRRQPGQEPTEAEQPQEVVDNAEPAEEPTGDPVVEPAEADDQEIDWSEAALSLDNERETDQDTVSDGEERSFSFSYRGQEETVDLATARELAELGRDYRYKTGKLGEQRRTMEAREAELSTQMEGLKQDRERLAKHLEKFISTSTPPDPQLALDDPDRYTALKARYDAEQAQAELAAKELDQERQRDREQAQKQFQDWHQKQSEIVNRRVPALEKDEVARDVLNYLTKGLRFTGDDVQGGVHMLDARFQEIAYKAYMFDKNRARKPKPKAPKATGGTGARSAPSGVGDLKKAVSESGDPRKAAEFLRARRAAR